MMKTLNPILWLQEINNKLKPEDYEIVRQAINLLQVVSADNSNTIGESHLIQGITTADILLKLNLDGATCAAAILHSGIPHTKLTIEDIAEHLGDEVAKLVRGTEQMSGISELYQGIIGSSNYQHNVDNIRKMLLAMVDDIQVVLIKIAEHLVILRNAQVLPEKIKKQLASETIAIYAPLTNRLGIAQLKWELEDLAFQYSDPEKYQEIVLALKQHFPESDKYIQTAIKVIEKILQTANIKKLQVTGRAKHIYSIYRKMNRKKIGLKGIYDVSALRIFVPSITDCYKVLSLIHSTWQYISEEFDDYIANPKPNGYQSIHTAVIGPNDRTIEIQIRTFEMHRQAELGVAAHWIYKEGRQEARYQTKLSWLREVMAWQQEVAKTEKSQINLQQIFNEHVYVFTPEGDLFELPARATPIDFAYHVHSELGHRSIGAKINNNLVPLTYLLKTGDRVEILTSRTGHPSRDWLIFSLGFLNTARARSKVLHWFKKQGQEYNINAGQQIIDREIKHLNLSKIDLKEAATKLSFKNSDDLLAALGSGALKFSSILHSLGIELKKEPEETLLDATLSKPVKERPTPDINIEGVGNLLVYTATCCKPIPGEKIIGYITQGRGISIHREDCVNALYIKKLHPERFISVDWSKKTAKKYPVDIVINAFSRPELARDITNIIADEKILIYGLDLATDKKASTTKIKLTIEISGLQPLGTILDKISKLPNIIEIYRSE